MKHVLATLGLFLTFILSSCSSDPCDNVTCQNGGTCVDGNCECTTFYVGNMCQSSVLTNFTGPYEGTYTLDGNLDLTVNRSFAIVGGQSNKMINIEDRYEMIFSSATEFTIPNQEVDDGILVTIYEGSGEFSASGNTVELNYTMQVITFTGDTGNVTPVTFQGTL